MILEDKDRVRAHVFISGKVQGVFFRWETREEANKRNVNGWVRNLRDGRVEAIFEGNKEKVVELIKFCHRGPRGAVVSRVDLKWEDYTSEFNDFRVIF
jgi:acylphosphatase